MAALFVFLLLKGSVALGLVCDTILHGSRVAPRNCSAGGEGFGCAFPRRIDCSGTADCPGGWDSMG